MCIQYQDSLHNYPQYKSPHIIHRGFKVMCNGNFPYFYMDEEGIPPQKNIWYNANVLRCQRDSRNTAHYLPAFHLFESLEDAKSHFCYATFREVAPILFSEVVAIGVDFDVKVIAARKILFLGIEGHG